MVRAPPEAERSSAGGGRAERREAETPTPNIYLYIPLWSRDFHLDQGNSCASGVLV